MKPEYKWAGLELYYLTIDTKLLDRKPSLPNIFFSDDTIVAITIAEQQYVQKNGLPNEFIIGYIQPGETDINESNFISQASFINWMLNNIILRENFVENFVVIQDHANYDNNETKKISSIKGIFSMDIIDDRVPYDEIPSIEDKYATITFKDGEIVEVVQNPKFRLVSSFGEPCFTRFSRSYLHNILLEMNAITL